MIIYLQIDWKNDEDIGDVLNIDSTSTQEAVNWGEKKIHCLKLVWFLCSLSP
jgi:hypothetical protein